MTCPVSTMESPPPDDPDGFCRPDSLHAIQGEIEDIEIAQPSRRREAPVFFVDRMRDDEGHDLLAQSAVGSKAMTMKAADVMLGAAGADHGMSLADRNEISLAIARHLVPARGALAVQNQRDPGHSGSRVHHRGKLQLLAQVHPDERSERAMMFHERVGDRADHAHCIWPKATIEFLFQ